MKDRYECLCEEEAIAYESPEYFDPYPDEKIRCKLHVGEKREQLKKSIMQSGVYEPIIAMKSEQRGRLIIIAGHNRVDICKELGIKVPYRLVDNITSEQADLLCIETNIMQRQIDEFRYSELAHILKVRRDVLYHQGKASFLDGDDTLCQSGTKTSTRLSRDYNLSERNIYRYIKLCDLIPELLALVDQKKIRFGAGVNLAYLTREQQEDVLEMLSCRNCKITLCKSEEIKRLSMDIEKVWSRDALLKLMDESKKENKYMKIPIDELREIVPEEDMGHVGLVIKVALQKYYLNTQNDKQSTYM